MERTGSDIAQTIRGGAGNDTLSGLGGNDVLVGNDGADRLAGGEGADRLVGGNGNDLLRGDAGNDSLNGSAGSDRATGGLGNDLYVVDSARDRVFEDLGGGTDTVRTLVSYALAAGEAVERLETTDKTATAAIDLSGNDGANRIVGNAGTNQLDGGGGDDILIGAAGRDAFLFKAALGANVDTIQTFSHADDAIRLSKSVFAEATGSRADGLGLLTPGEFALTTQAGRADDRIVYDPSTGHLFYDPNGGSRANAVLFAVIDNPATAGLAADDFALIA